MHLGNLTGNALQAYVATDSVALVHRHGWQRPRLEGVSQAIQADQSASQPWEQALQTLRELIESRRWTGLPVDIAVSSEFVRFALVPGINLNLSSSQLQGLAHSRFARIIGESMNAWTLRYCALDKTTLLAAAIRKPLQDDLEALALECHLKLRSVAPLWSCALNSRHRQFTAEPGWLVLVESRATTFGLVENGRLVAVRTRMLDPAQASAVSAFLDRERRNIGSAVRDVHIVGDATGKGVALGGDWHIRFPLPGAPQAADLPAACRLAAAAGC